MPNRDTDFTVKRWKGNEYHVCFKGQPVGPLLYRREAVQVKLWLGAALDQLLAREAHRDAQSPEPA